MSEGISAVVVIGERRWRADRCLAALLSQDANVLREIIVVDVRPNSGPLQQAQAGRIRYFPRPEALSIAEAKTFGYTQARSEVIAFVEDHCVAGHGWATAVWDVFSARPDVDAVAYAFHNLNPVNYVSRSFLLLAYGPWMAPASSGYIPSPSWMNVAYRERALRLFADRLPVMLECESVLQRELRKSGSRFWHAADAPVSHLNHPGLLGSCRDSAVWQRLFAAARVRREQWSWARRLAYVAGSPLSPWVIAFRLGRRMWQRPGFRLRYFTSLPLILTVYTYGMFNEALGYFFGMGDAGRESLEVETGDPRGEPA